METMPPSISDSVDVALHTLLNSIATNPREPTPEYASMDATTDVDPSDNFSLAELPLDFLDETQLSEDDGVERSDNADDLFSFMMQSMFLFSLPSPPCCS